MSIERSTPNVPPKRAVDGVDARHTPKPGVGANAPIGAVNFLSLLTSFGAGDDADADQSTLLGLDSALSGGAPQGQPPADPGVKPDPQQPGGAGLSQGQPAAVERDEPASQEAGQMAGQMAVAAPLGLNPGQLMLEKSGSDALSGSGERLLREPGGLADARLQAPGGADVAPKVPGQTALEHLEGGLPAEQHDMPGHKPGSFGRMVAARAVAAAMAERQDRAEKVVLRATGVAEALGIKGGDSAASALAEARNPASGGLPELKGREALLVETITVATGSGGAGSGLGGQSEKHASDRMSDPGAKVPGDGAWTGVGLHEGATPEFALVSPDGTMLPVEQEVAEQVRYWIANDVQNAELTLDGFGKDPVEVSISLTGNEAQVEFRTDRQEMRQVLEGASVRLKEMLASEGLVLTGVSVGASGTDGAGAKDQLPPREGVRRTLVMASVPVAASTAARPAGAVGRALDVFV